MKKIFVNYERCVACKACEINCAVAHHPAKNLYGMVGDEKTAINVSVIDVAEHAFPVSCRHCDPAYCLDACPSGAIQRDEQTNAVIIDAYMCKACAMCAMVCPFDAISFKKTHESKFNRDVAYKCDLCIKSIKNGGQPACVTACKTGALEFKEFDHIKVERAKVHLKHYLFGEEDIPQHIQLYRKFKKAIQQSY